MRHKCFLRLLLLLLYSTACIHAQSTDASISGQVVDPSGSVIPNAEIQILNEETGIQYGNKTNNSGIYTVSILPPGEYRVQVSKIGFKTLIKPGIILNVQSSVALNFTLPLGAASESVTVDAGASIINTTDATVGTVVDQKFVANIPLNGRSFQDLIALTPGVVTQSPQAKSSFGSNGDFSVNGQRTESNYYTVDGVTGNVSSGVGYGEPGPATGGALGGGTALGTTQSLVPVEALQEFRVQTSTYSAEYGRSPGGQFSLVTRSGTNRFHGSLFDYFRNDLFDANDWFNDYYNKSKAALHQNDFGGTAGGPVSIPHLYGGKDHTFFFAAYEGLRLTQPVAATIQYVPDSFMRQDAVAVMRPILGAFPNPNGMDYGSESNPSLAQFIQSYSLPSTIDSTSVRVDHVVSPKLSIFFRAGLTPSSTSSRPYFALNTTKAETQTYTLGATSQLTSTVTNDFRLGYDRADTTIKGVLDTFGGASPYDIASAMGAGSLPSPYPVMYLSFDGIGTSDLAAGSTASSGRQWNLVDSVATTFGRHQVKVGVDYRKIKSPLKSFDPEMFLEFLGPNSILAGIPDVPEILRYKASTPIFNEFSAFAQDEWKVSSRLNLSLGVRWDVNPAPTEAHGDNAYTLEGSIANPATLTVAPQGTPLWNTSWFNIAPRLGAAWVAHQDSRHETVIRTGVGVFYDTLNQVGALGFLGVGFEGIQYPYGSSLPFSVPQLTFQVAATPPYSNVAIYAFPRHLQSPYTLQWNLSMQETLGNGQAVTISYVGANGRRLIGEQELALGSLNHNFGYVYYFPGGITSNYQALQLQFQRTVSHGLHALASYVWAHSLDYGSTGTATPLMRGNSDYDVRNSFQAGLSWDVPSLARHGFVAALSNGWGIDGRIMVRSGFPIPLKGSTFTDPGNGQITYKGLNIVPGQAFYLYGNALPGGRIVNKAAFAVPVSGVAGDAPRNFLRGFGESQFNLAARREIRLNDAVGIQFRAEAFNIFNHPNFGYIDPLYSDATFGHATQMLNQSLGTVAPQYQQGGPRSMQFALKLQF